MGALVCVEDALLAWLPADGESGCVVSLLESCGEPESVVFVVIAFGAGVCGDVDCPAAALVCVDDALSVSLPDEAEGDCVASSLEVAVFMAVVSAAGICDNVDCPAGASVCGEDVLSASLPSVRVEDALSASLPVEEAGGSFSGLALAEVVSSSLPPYGWVEADDDVLTLDTAIFSCS
ncbi:hypothetical protein [Caballeronia sp. LZ035]|uniref:hypothetical protein n=1 Tax=Caballeronia sp. LZ035 TaxID=3038568 RepID=UPI00285FED58|nr:hypothetical protein [Caballeronia sp. LZ035]MDR5760145.1 hypothetical protein [Caballeronia sp. LZ035]